MTLPQASRNGLSHEAYHALRKAILIGELRPGDWLVESVIAEHMRISRGPIREALKRLQQEGLVTEIPRKGKRVTLLTEADVRELQVLRAMLEGHAARLLCAAERRARAVSRLERTLARMRKAALSGNMDHFSQMDFDFHREIVSSSGLPRLCELWNGLNGLLLIWLLTVQDSVRILLKEVLNDHLRLLRAIKAGDESIAERLLRDHILKRGDQMLRGSRHIVFETPRPVPPRRRAKRGLPLEPHHARVQ